jgi:uncharacterized membrane protein
MTSTSEKTGEKIDEEPDVVCKIAKKKPLPELIKYSGYLFGGISVAILITSFFTYYLFGLNDDNLHMLVGLGCSVLATYYKLRIKYDPRYKPSCNCFTEDTVPKKHPDSMMYDVLNVIDHKYGSMLFNVPNSVWGILFYMFLLVVYNYNISMIWFNSMEILWYLTVVSCIGGTYLWYLMIFRIKSVCVLCMTVHSANFLTLVSLYLRM